MTIYYNIVEDQLYICRTAHGRSGIDCPAMYLMESVDFFTQTVYTMVLDINYKMEWIKVGAL